MIHGVPVQVKKKNSEINEQPTCATFCFTSNNGNNDVCKQIAKEQTSKIQKKNRDIQISYRSPTLIR